MRGNKIKLEWKRETQEHKRNGSGAKEGKEE